MIPSLILETDPQDFGYLSFGSYTPDSEKDSRNLESRNKNVLEVKI